MAFIPSSPSTSLAPLTRSAKPFCSIRNVGRRFTRPSAPCSGCGQTVVLASARPSTPASASGDASAGTSRRALLVGLAAATAAAALPLPAALADHTKMAAERSYQRYFPRIEAGVDQVLALRDAISAGDLAAARELAADKAFAVKLRRALNIYATSFSDSNINEQSRNLLAAVDGFYGAVEKATTASSQEEAVENYNEAASAYKSYLRVARLWKLKDVSLAL